MVAMQAGRLAAEALVTQTPKAQAGRLAAEALVTQTPKAQAGRLAAEVLVSPSPGLQVGAELVEVLVGFAPALRVGAVFVEVMTPARGVGESSPLSDSSSSTAELPASVSEALALSDSSDSSVTGVTYNVDVQEAVGLADAASSAADLAEAVAEAVDLQDASAQGTILAGRLAAEALVSPSPGLQVGAELVEVLVGFAPALLVGAVFVEVMTPAAGVGESISLADATDALVIPIERGEQGPHSGGGRVPPPSHFAPRAAEAAVDPSGQFSLEVGHRQTILRPTTGSWAIEAGHRQVLVDFRVPEVQDSQGTATGQFSVQASHEQGFF